jgi:hypothetical protein
LLHDIHCFSRSLNDIDINFLQVVYPAAVQLLECIPPQRDTLPFTSFNQEMPYLFSHALEAQHKGIPLMRAMLLKFPDDPTCDYLDRQYMLGESLLSAPVLSPDNAVT